MNIQDQDKQSLSPLQKALLALKDARIKLASYERFNEKEPIAIVGMGCRFPGDANTLEHFWNLLHHGVDTITEIPSDRWNLDDLYDSNPEALGKVYTRAGGFLHQHHIDQFDPQFFGISPKEALSLDPQHRLLLQVSWEALENMGQAPQNLENSLTGVFFGISQIEYARLALSDSNQYEQLNIYDGTGSGLSFASGRLSFLLGLQGPSMSIDTSCSSSLLAVHLACQSLRNRECNLAIVGGVNLNLLPEGTILLSTAKALSPDGRCKTFDASADGFSRGEGCGVVILKRVSDAINDRDIIWAVIRGSAVNHDGPSSGLTVPNQIAQEKLIHQALKNAKVEPIQVSYVEAHGTGTSLGDPIEVGALASVLCDPHRNWENPLAIGSVKTNIGHLEAGAGIASLIKVVMSLHHEEIPPNLHFYTPNPHIPWNEFPLVVPTSPMPWPRGEQPRIAGVSSFGMSGTNAHVLLEEAPIQLKVTAKDSLERPIHILSLSAKTEKALNQLVSRYQKYLETHPGLELADICYTANIGRNQFKHRLAVIASDQQELVKKLSNLEAKEEVTGVLFGQLYSGESSTKVAFIFTGQGSQYQNMGWQLYQTQPVFRKALDKCDQILSSYIEKSLLKVIYSQDVQDSNYSLLEQTAYTQPAIFAIEYALAELWKSWGIKPDVVLGHSVGEYVAACIAGVFTLEDGLKLIATRAKLMQQLPSKGRMLAVMASEQKVNQLITPYAEKVAVAAINGPESVVISGASEFIEELNRRIENEGIKTKYLEVSHAFHSPLMKPMLVAFENVAKEVTYNQPQIPIISNVTGEKIFQKITTAQYWVDHVENPVKFAQSIKTLAKQGYEVFLEIGPKPILLSLGQQCLPDNQKIWLPSLRPGIDDWQQMLDSLGQLYVRGAQIDWSGFDRGFNRSKVVLPTYPFQKQRYWKETVRSDSKAISSVKLHPLIDKKFQSPLSKDIFFESNFSIKILPFLADHRVYQKIVVPGASHICLLLAAASLSFPTQEWELEDIIFPQGLAIREQGIRTIQVALSPQDGAYSFQVISFDGDVKSQVQNNSNNTQQFSSWAVHTTGKIIPSNNKKIIVSVKQIQSRCHQKIESEKIYQEISNRQIQLGESFRWINQVWLGDGEVLCQMKLPEILQDIDKYQLHPTLLDSCFQSLTALSLNHSSKDNQTFVPFRIEKFIFYSPPESNKLWCHGYVDKSQSPLENTLKTDIQLLDKNGHLVAMVKGFESRKATPQLLLTTLESDINNWFYEVEWKTKARFCSLLSADYLLTPLEIKQQVGNTIIESLPPTDLEHYQETFTYLENLSAEYIVQAFVELGWDYQPGEKLSLDSVAQHLGVVSNHQQLLNRLLQILEEIGIVCLTQQQWQVQQTLNRISPVQQNQSPQKIPEINLLHRCASQLSRVLRGELDPVQLVFPQGDLTDATKIYGESPISKLMNTIVEKTITAAIEKLPGDRGIRLLEIGAGTGGTTSYILPELPAEQTEYVFTDIGKLFITKAQEKFSDYPFIRYQTLDIEIDPAPQGFENQKYDIIIAANVLHATTSIKETLSNVRKLLADGGILVLLEVTTRQRVPDLIFGLLEGWWKFKDVEWRHDYPLLSVLKWKQLLEETGFGEVETIPEIEILPEVLSHQAVIVARAQEIADENKTAGKKDWLILADNQGIAQHLASQIRKTGEVCRLVFAGSEYQQLTPEEYTINPQKPEDFQQLLTQLVTYSPNLYGVVQCWTTEVGIDTNISSEELETLSLYGCGTTLSIVQALVQAEFSQYPRLWIVTQGSQPVVKNGDLLPGIAQSSLWGMGKVISLEHPELNSVRIDLDPNQSVDRQGLTLWSEISSEETEDQVALREDARYVARLVNAHYTPRETPISFDREKTYLITGGLGGLGLVVARWMVEKGAKYLVLVGRRPPDDAAQTKLKQLEQAGAEVTVQQGDVSEYESMKRMLSNINQFLPPLKGIIHSVGVLSDGVLKNQNWSKFDLVMKPKVQGAWNLHQLTQNQSLDFFVMFSSIASLFGSPGQGNHSAANAFLDALAYHRRGMGLPGLSINWGTVSQVGKAAELGADIRGQSQGVGAIAPDQVLETLERLIYSSSVEVGVVPLDWSTCQERATESPFFMEFRKNVQTSSTSQVDFIEQLVATLPSERREVLVNHISYQVAQVLGLSPQQQVDIKQGFFEQGMDSLMAVEIQGRLQKSLGFSIASNVVFNYPKVEALADYLIENSLKSYFSGIEQTTEEKITELETQTTELENVSKDEILELLAQELELNS